MCDWLNKFYSFFTFQLLYMILAIQKMDGRPLLGAGHLSLAVSAPMLKGSGTLLIPFLF